MRKFKIFYLSWLLLIVLILTSLFLIKIDVLVLLKTTFLNDHYYLEIFDQEKPFYYLNNHQIYLVESFQQLENNIYLIELKFDSDQQPIFFQIEKNVPLLTYLFTAIFKI